MLSVLSVLFNLQNPKQCPVSVSLLNIGSIINGPLRQGKQVHLINVETEEASTSFVYGHTTN